MSETIHRVYSSFLNSNHLHFLTNEERENVFKYSIRYFHKPSRTNDLHLSMESYKHQRHDEPIFAFNHRLKIVSMNSLLQIMIAVIN